MTGQCSQTWPHEKHCHCATLCSQQCSDNSPPNNDSVLPILQQPYHHDSDAMTVDHLTPNGEEPGEHDYEFTASGSNVEELTEFDYGGDIRSNHTSQSSTDEDDLYWGLKL